MIKKNKKLIINNTNLILGAALGYSWDDLKIFIKSLRKFENCRVILIFEDTLNQRLKNEFRNYKIEYFIHKQKKKEDIPGLTNSKSDVGQRRYEMYEQVLKKIKNKPKTILLTDTRDVVFQKNLFKNKFKKTLNFFLENEIILNDPRNSRWLERTVGKKEYNKIKVPLVVRLAGTNFKEGKEILDKSGLKLISAENLDDAAKKIVEAIK